MSPQGDTFSVSRLCPAGRSPDDLSVALRVPLRSLGRVRDLDPEIEDQPRDPRRLLGVDLVDLVGRPVIVLVGPVEEEQDRDAAAGSSGQRSSMAVMPSSGWAAFTRSRVAPRSD